MDPNDKIEEEQQEFELEERPLFQHPPWMLGIVLVFAVISAFAGLVNPVWWLIGSPFFVVFAIVIWIRLRLLFKSD